MVAEPNGVQLTPSVEIEPVIELPVRVSLSQTPVEADLVMLVGILCVAERAWNVTPFPGVRASMTKRESPFRVSRIMTPALAHEFVFV